MADQPMADQQDDVDEAVMDAEETIRRDAEFAAALAREEETSTTVVSRFVRRSVRDPSAALLERADVQILLTKIRQNHSDTVVLKIKDMILSDINTVVMDEILLALAKNTVCQALYVQNLDRAIEDKQLRNLVELLKKRCIWNLNIGETYFVCQNTWSYFCDELLNTSVTHLYVSEHVIELEMKNQMRENIRKNRKKHNMHCSLENIRVIERCTNMWWNPINAIRHQLEASTASAAAATETAIATAAARRSATTSSRAKKPKRSAQPTNQPKVLTPDTLEYWAEGGGAKPWKFKCKCGETCCSSDPFRFHPVGEQFECTRCNTWSHVHCVLGPETSADDLEELEELLCFPCRSVAARASNLRLQSISLTWVPGQGAIEQKQSGDGEVNVAREEGSCKEDDLSTIPSVMNHDKIDLPSIDDVEHGSAFDIQLQVAAPDEAANTAQVGEKRPLILEDTDKEL